MKYFCKTCRKDWKLKTDYDKHINCCEFFYNFRRNQSEMEEFGMKVPSQKEMFRFIQDLANKCDRLEKEVNRLKNNMNIKQKKSILECLNNPGHTPTQTFHEWYKTMAVEESHLKSVFARDADLSNGIKAVLEHYIHNTDMMSLRAFTQKPNTFYIYTGVSASVTDETISPWRLMTNADMESLIMHLSQLFLIAFLNWQRIHAMELREKTEVMEDKELIYLMKINGGKTPMEKRVMDLKKWLYDNIKMNITDMEYV